MPTSRGQGPETGGAALVISLALAGFIATLDDYIVAVSLPSIAADFNASTSTASWVTVAYLLTLVSTLLLFGRLGDRLGHPGHHLIDTDHAHVPVGHQRQRAASLVGRAVVEHDRAGLGDDTHNRFGVTGPHMEPPIVAIEA